LPQSVIPAGPASRLAVHAGVAEPALLAEGKLAGHQVIPLLNVDILFPVPCRSCRPSSRWVILRDGAASGWRVSVGVEADLDAVGIVQPD
jgi:hypothetical protein